MVTKFNIGELKLTIQNSMQTVYGQKIRLACIISTKYAFENVCAEFDCC